ncbi:MAG: hypothetical protein RsTaC01_0482 [Candidatus Paraimprobicoccus trichonymphae]|uniref:Uncharacterized protein n=1 Tax=Candidatus Paraimprobicoccus trichonymphae TaxID=3033793 RepID=A0AA48KZ85_9FIRM|nr:MAG: hypothetical protein RsTaC01_0482 [Candidatus Paraimprobicoccus trichonymphae]
MKKNLRLKSILASLLLISSSIGLAAESNEKDKKSLVSPIVQTVGAGLGLVGTFSLLYGGLLSSSNSDVLIVAGCLSVPGSISAVALGNGIYRIVSKNTSSKIGGIVSLTTGVLSTASSLCWGYLMHRSCYLFKNPNNDIHDVFACSVAPVAVLTSGLTLIGSSIYTFATCPKINAKA